MVPNLLLWLDLGDIRVVHACWHEESRRSIEDLTGSNRLTAALRGGRNKRWEHFQSGGYLAERTGTQPQRLRPTAVPRLEWRTRATTWVKVVACKKPFARWQRTKYPHRGRRFLPPHCRVRELGPTHSSVHLHLTHAGVLRPIIPVTVRPTIIGHGTTTRPVSTSAETNSTLWSHTAGTESPDPIQKFCLQTTGKVVEYLVLLRY